MKYIKRIIPINKIIPAILRINDFYNTLLKKMIKFSYKIRAFFYAEGSNERPSHDHDISVYYRWQLNGYNFWNKVAAFSDWTLYNFDEKVILELGCANGWYLREFYSKYESLVYYGYDVCVYTIVEAKRKLLQKEKAIGRKINALFEVQNILTNDNIYKIDATNVFWYASMCMFSKKDRRIIFENISKSLKKNKGIFCGSADVELEGVDQWDRYIGLYKDDDELVDELSMFFENVYISPRNKNESLVMFMASDGELPFYNKKNL